MNMWKTLNKGIMKAFGMNIETDTATLNDESFLEWVGIKRDSESKKPTSDVTYFTCLKMMSETVAKMPWKLYQKTNKGISEPIDNDIARLMKQRPNPFMTPTTFWNAVEMNRNHYGNAYVYVRRKFKRKKYGGEHWTCGSCRQTGCRSLLTTKAFSQEREKSGICTAMNIRANSTYSGQKMSCTSRLRIA